MAVPISRLTGSMLEAARNQSLFNPAFKDDSDEYGCAHCGNIQRGDPAGEDGDGDPLCFECAEKFDREMREHAEAIIAEVGYAAAKSAVWQYIRHNNLTIREATRIKEHIKRWRENHAGN